MPAISRRSTKSLQKHLDKINILYDEFNEMESPKSLTPYRANRYGPAIKNSCTMFDHMDIVSLAQIYNSPMPSPIAHEDLLDVARTALLKYELAEYEFEIAADSLARSMHMLLEQQGVKKLTPKHMAALEKEVIEWCGISKSIVSNNQEKL